MRCFEIGSVPAGCIPNFLNASALLRRKPLFLFFIFLPTSISARSFPLTLANAGQIGAIQWVFGMLVAISFHSSRRRTDSCYPMGLWKVVLSNGSLEDWFNQPTFQRPIGWQLSVLGLLESKEMTGALRPGACRALTQHP